MIDERVPVRPETREVARLCLAWWTGAHLTDEPHSIHCDGWPSESAPCDCGWAELEAALIILEAALAGPPPVEEP